MNFFSDFSSSTRIVIASLSFFCVLSCVKQEGAVNYQKLVPDCDSYMEYVNSSEKYGSIVSWADKTIFSREFKRDDFTTGWFSGPGLANDTIDLGELGISAPDWFSGYKYEVRLVTKNRDNFDAIFIGGGKYGGLLIVRSDWKGRSEDVFLRRVEFKAVHGRAGVICYSGPK